MGLLQHAALHGIGPAEDGYFIELHATPRGFTPPRICRLCGVVFYTPIDTTAADRDTEAPRRVDIEGALPFPEAPLPAVPLEGGGPFPVAPSFLPPGFRPEKLVLSSNLDEATALEALRACGFELESSLDVEEEGPVTPSLATPRLIENEEDGEDAKD